MWWDCPEWLCWLWNGHALIQKWADYNVDKSGTRCNCGKYWTDDDNPGVLHNYNEYQSNL